MLQYTIPNFCCGFAMVHRVWGQMWKSYTFLRTMIHRNEKHLNHLKSILTHHESLFLEPLSSWFWRDHAPTTLEYLTCKVNAANSVLSWLLARALMPVSNWTKSTIRLKCKSLCISQLMPPSFLAILTGINHTLLHLEWPQSVHMHLRWLWLPTG